MGPTSAIVAQGIAGREMLEGITLSTGDRSRLEAVVADRNSPQKHVWRAQIVLLAADGFGTAAIMRRSGKSKNAVNRWRDRFRTDGVDALLRDKTRPSRIPPLPAAVRERTVALTLADPPGAATHWTAAMMAKTAGISVSSVQRLWRATALGWRRKLAAVGNARRRASFRRACGFRC